MKNAQASIELITILAVSLLVLGIIMAVSRSTFEDMQTSLDAQLAEKSMRTLAGDAELAYRNGPGTIIKSTLHIPATIVADGSYFDDGILNLHMEHKYGARDLPQPFTVPVEGRIPFVPGDYEIYCVSHAGYVYITESPSLFPTTHILYMNEGAGEQRQIQVLIKNPGPEKSMVSASLDPEPTDFDLKLSWASATIEPGAEKALLITSYSEKPLDYEGHIKLVSTTGEHDRVLVRVKVE